MATSTKEAAKAGIAKRGYNDLHEHIDLLRKAGLLIEIDREINKDTEMHPLVRWQFRGGIDEADRKAFLFTNVVDSKGRKFDIPVLVCGLAANRKVYTLGMGVPIEDIGAPVYHVSHMTSFQVAKNLAAQDEADSLWGRRHWHNHEVIYDNPDGWGLGAAPVTRIDDRIWRIEFDWAAVAPLVDWRRVVLSGMATQPA